MMKQKLIICECHSPEHQVILNYDEEYNLIYAEYHLCPLPFFQRVWHAIKYAFGYRCKYGDFDEILIGEEYADVLIELGTELKKNSKRSPSES